jgi:hypothetical protein
MVDEPNYKNDLTPEQYEVSGIGALNLRFQASTMTARTRASTSVSAVARAYLPPTPNSILAPVGPAFGPQLIQEV